MRVSLTERQGFSESDLRPAAEFAPALAVPWLTRLRYGLITGQVSLILAATLVSHIRLHLFWLAIPLAATLISNILLQRLIARLGAREALGFTLVVDVLALTAQLALTGGPANPLTLLYLVQITLSAVVLSRAWTWSLGLCSILGFGFLFLFHVPLPVLEGHHPAQGFSVHLYGMWIAFVAAALLITFFIGEVSEALRRHERQALRLQTQIGRHEKLAAIATLAAGAAHEMGTPLATIAIVAKDLEHYAANIANDPHLSGEAALIRGEVNRCGCILRAMSAEGAEFSGESPMPVKVKTLLQDLVAGLPSNDRSSIHIAAADELKAVLPVETTRQVLAALVRNALDASGDGQHIELCVDRVDGRLRFTVRDFGEGMTAETLAHLGEPFFTTKAPGKGMGLGTFLARVFAENLQGSLEYDSVAGQGTTAMLELPLATNA